MKTSLMLLLIVLTAIGTRCVRAADDDDEPSKADIKRMENAKKHKDDLKFDMETRIRARAEKGMRDGSSGGGTWSRDGISHVIEYHNGKKIERDFYNNGCSVTTASTEINGVHDLCDGHFRPSGKGAGKIFLAA